MIATIGGDFFIFGEPIAAVGADFFCRSLRLALIFWYILVFTFPPALRPAFLVFSFIRIAIFIFLLFRFFAFRRVAFSTIFFTTCDSLGAYFLVACFSAGPSSIFIVFLFCTACPAALHGLAASLLAWSGRAFGAARPRASLLATFLLAVPPCWGGRSSQSACSVLHTCLGPAVFGVGFSESRTLSVCVCVWT